jgi:DNA-binding response OmpR family regulator
LAPVKLLLVDDDESVLTGLGAVLEAHEFEVTTASSVMEALQHIASESFDVLLSDLHMPGDGDGLIVIGAMRHANPKAVTLLLSANPDMTKASAAMLRHVDDIVTKPVKPDSIVQAIRQRLAQENPLPHSLTIESAAAVLERESASVTQAWLQAMKETGGLTAAPMTEEEQCDYLPDAIDEIVYRLRYPQRLGSMTLFSMAALQHGVRRRRQGLGATVLVEEARALQVALFQAVQHNLDLIGVGQLSGTLMVIADEVNAQLLQSLSGYENEKPVGFPQDNRPALKPEKVEREISQGPEIEVKACATPPSWKCSRARTTVGTTPSSVVRPGSTSTASMLPQGFPHSSPLRSTADTG